MQSAKVPATTHPFKPFHLHLKFHWHAVISILHQETEERLVLNPAILIDTVIACNCALFMRHTKEGLKIDVAFTSYLKRAIKYLDIRHLCTRAVLLKQKLTEPSFVQSMSQPRQQKYRRKFRISAVSAHIVGSAIYYIILSECFQQAR